MDIAIEYDLGLQGVAGIFNRPLSTKSEPMVSELVEDATVQDGYHADSGYGPIWIQIPPPSLARAVGPGPFYLSVQVPASTKWR